MVEIIRKLVRPFIALSLTCSVIYLAVLGKIDAKELLGYVGIVIGFYFGERSALKIPGSNS